MLSEVELDEIKRRVCRNDDEVLELQESGEQTSEEAEIEVSVQITEDPLVTVEEDSSSQLDGHVTPEEEIVRQVIDALANINENNRPVPPKIDRVDKNSLAKEVSKVDRALSQISTKNIKETNDLILAGAFVVTKRLGLKNKSEQTPRMKQQNTISAQKRIEKEIETHRKDLSRLICMKKNKENIRAGDNLEKKVQHL